MVGHRTVSALALLAASFGPGCRCAPPAERPQDEAVAPPSAVAEDVVRPDAPTAPPRADASRRLVGRWTLDVDRLEAIAAEARASGDEEAPVAVALMAAVDPSYEFRSDGSMVVTMRDPEGAEPPRVLLGRWAVTGGEGQVLAVRVTDDQGPAEMVAVFADEERMQLSEDATSRGIPLTRQPPTPRPGDTTPRRETR